MKFLKHKKKPNHPVSDLGKLEQRQAKDMKQ